MTAAFAKHRSVELATDTIAPRVSVIIIFLNEERFIEEAIESVFAQTFNDWELLLVDDGSTDESTAIALDRAARHPQRVFYLQHEDHTNRGMSASRNLGILKSRGEYIAFLDADDLWVPRKLEQQVSVMEAHPSAGMVYGGTEYWAGWTGNGEERRQDFVPDLAITPDSLIEPPALLPVLLRNQVVTTTAALARRDVITSLGGFEESFRGLHEDQVFCAKICLHSPVFVSQQCWYKYRRHHDSCCAVAERSGQHRHERRVFLRWLERYLQEIRMSDARVWREFRKARRQANHPLLWGLLSHLRYRALRQKEGLRLAARKWLPKPIYRWLRRFKNGARYVPRHGDVRFGDLRRTKPFSRVFGYDRGRPVDRYYIERFLTRNANHIQGRVLEIGDDSYTRAYGNGQVTGSDILSVVEGSPRATIIADLTDAAHIPSDSFDCIILTQTLHLIYDVRAAIETLRRILKPGGVLLATVPGISQIDHYEWRNSWYWSFTELSARRLFSEVFGSGNISVENHGNVLAATAFLHGLSWDEITSVELDAKDDDYQIVITIKAEKKNLE